MIRKARAVWHGTGLAAVGIFPATSGVLSENPVFIPESIGKREGYQS